MMARACIVCGRPVPKRTVTRDFQHNDESAPRSKADCARLTNHQIVSVRYWHTGRVRHFSTWDGESYSNRGFFCTNACAERQGYASAQQGARFNFAAR